MAMWGLKWIMVDAGGIEVQTTILLLVGFGQQISSSPTATNAG
jgi:hypothetical protein